MSKFVKVKTELRETALVRTALSDLKLTWKEGATYAHLFSGARAEVAFLITLPGATYAPTSTFGLRATPEGALEAVGDDMQMAAIRATMERIQQRYAYHIVLREVEKAGFSLVEEKTGQDQVIRLTVRRWN